MERKIAHAIPVVTTRANPIAPTLIYIPVSFGACNHILEKLYP
jgi:hypothetical protein